jgi:hypothetical protein
MHRDVAVAQQHQLPRHSSLKQQEQKTREIGKLCHLL